MQQAGDGTVNIDVSFDAPVRAGVTIDLMYYRARVVFLAPDHNGRNIVRTVISKAPPE